jgi:hypothetical protein
MREPCSGDVPDGTPDEERDYGSTMTTLEVLAAKDAITDACLRYCRGIDRCDAELVKSSYHADAYDDHGTFKGNAWEFADLATQSLKRYLATMHATMNHLITEVDTVSGTAKGEIYVNAYHLREADGKKVVDVWWGRYIDEYSRKNGDWRISSRVVVHEWTAQMPIEQAMPIPAEMFRPGSFDRNA